MIRHIVSWNFQPQLSDAEKAAATAAIMEKANSLAALIPNTIKAEMICPPLGSSTCAIALYSEFETEEHLAAYQVHPEHLKVVELIKANLCDRTCIDILG